MRKMSTDTTERTAEKPGSSTSGLFSRTSSGQSTARLASRDIRIKEPLGELIPSEKARTRHGAKCHARD